MTAGTPPVPFSNTLWGPPSRLLKNGRQKQNSKEWSVFEMLK
jgi:hypothetical protein